MQLPNTVESIKTVDEMSGRYIEITFKNGAVVWVSAENDAIHYFGHENTAREEDCATINPTASLLVDFGAGYHENYSSHVTVMRGSDCRQLDVDHY